MTVTHPFQARRVPTDCAICGLPPDDQWHAPAAADLMSARREPRTVEGRAVIEVTASDPFIPEDQKPALREAALRTVLAIEAEVSSQAGHRFENDHDCFAANCKALGREVESLRSRLAACKAAADEGKEGEA